MEKIGKEKKFNDPEDDDHFNDNHLPKAAAHSHAAEAFNIEADDAVKFKVLVEIWPRILMAYGWHKDVRMVNG